MRPHFAVFLSTFVDVVRAGSFSGAARRRAVTPSAIVRQIDTLEEDLGVALLVRSTRALTLTDAGRRLHERALLLLDELADTHAEIAAFDGSVSGTLRIACFPTFGKRYVLPVVAALQTEHPALKVELDLTERLADPVLERLDVVIRMGALADSTLIATRLAPLTRLLVASPAYLARAGVPDSVADLSSHRLIDKLHGADLLGWRDAEGQVGCGRRRRAEIAVAALAILGARCRGGHFHRDRGDDDCSAGRAEEVVASPSSNQPGRVPLMHGRIAHQA